MNIMNLIPQGLSRAVGKLWLKTKKASPELFIAGGFVVGAGALVMVAVETWKHKDILAEDAKKVKEAKQVGYTAEEVPAKDPKTGEIIEGETVTVKTKRKLTEDETKILWATRLDFGKDLVKVYWRPAILAGASAALIIVGKNKYRGMLSAAVATCTALAEDNEKYRKLIANEIGKEKEEQLAHGYKMEERVDAETGKTEKIPVKTETGDLTPYSFWFDEGVYDPITLEAVWRNMEFDRDKITNRLKVRAVQEATERKLRTIGYAWLEDVAIEFGIDPDIAKKWHYIGWLYDPEGDNHVSFGVLEGDDQLEVNKGFTDDTCSQNKCLINPNVTGYIGFVRDDYRKYDMRYGFGKRAKVNMEEESEKIIHRYNKEKMERMIFNSMSNDGKFNLFRRATRSAD